MLAKKLNLMPTDKLYMSIQCFQSTFKRFQTIKFLCNRVYNKLSKSTRYQNRKCSESLLQRTLQSLPFRMTKPKLRSLDYDNTLSNGQQCQHIGTIIVLVHQEFVLFELEHAADSQINKNSDFSNDISKDSGPN